MEIMIEKVIFLFLGAIGVGTLLGFFVATITSSLSVINS